MSQFLPFLSSPPPLEAARGDGSSLQLLHAIPRWRLGSGITAPLPAYHALVTQPLPWTAPSASYLPSPWPPFSCLLLTPCPNTEEAQSNTIRPVHLPCCGADVSDSKCHNNTKHHTVDTYGAAQEGYTICIYRDGKTPGCWKPSAKIEEKCAALVSYLFAVGYFLGRRGEKDKQNSPPFNGCITHSFSNLAKV